MRNVIIGPLLVAVWVDEVCAYMRTPVQGVAYLCTPGQGVCLYLCAGGRVQRDNRRVAVWQRHRRLHRL